MYARLVGWSLFVGLLSFSMVLFAEERKASDDSSVGMNLRLNAPILAQAAKSTDVAKPGPAPTEKPKDSVREAVSREEFETAISRIEQQLEKISQSLSQPNGAKATPETQTVRRQSAADEQPTLAAPAQAGSTNQAGPTQAEFEDLRDRVYDQEATLANITKTISQPGGAQRRVLDIRGNMQDSTFRNELADAVNEVMPRQGNLHIHNTTGTTQTLLVNRQSYQIAPGDRLQVTVPVGTVTTELVGFEAPRNWSIGPPTFEARIAIGYGQERAAAYQPIEAGADSVPSQPSSVYSDSTCSDSAVMLPVQSTASSCCGTP